MYPRYLTLPIRWLRPSSDGTHADDTVREARLDLEAVYAEHRNALWSFALRLLADRTAAEDLVHDVFVALPSLWYKMQPDTPMRSFLLGVTANLARNHTRAMKRRRRFADLWGKETLAATGEHPEHLACRRSLAVRLQDALARLSHEHRVVFVLVEVEQHTTLEAAEILELPPGTVRSRLFHAKHQLQAHLWNNQEGA